ncbi:hypothetical protein HDU90_004267 [Geranomyces variabilis]|nr:hypothetical protein HDU90_004267 [Geranomyces variabilis]
MCARHGKDVPFDDLNRAALPRRLHRVARTTCDKKKIIKILAIRIGRVVTGLNVVSKWGSIGVLVLLDVWWFLMAYAILRVASKPKTKIWFKPGPLPFHPTTLTGKEEDFVLAVIKMWRQILGLYSTFTLIEFVALVREPLGYGHKAWTIRVERQLYEGSALAPVPAASSLFVSATSVFVGRHETLKDGVNLLFRSVPEIQIHRFA